MPMTLAEKIIARAAGREAVRAGELVTCRVDLAMSHDSSGPRRVAPLLESLGAKVWDPSRYIIVSDHYVPAFDDESRQILRFTRDWARENAITHYDAQGICHIVLPERGHVRPGMLIVGGDSHSPTGGAFGAYMFGVGATEMVGVLVTGEIWLKVPETVRITWDGTLAEGPSSSICAWRRRCSRGGAWQRTCDCWWRPRRCASSSSPRPKARCRRWSTPARRCCPMPAAPAPGTANIGSPRFARQVRAGDVVVAGCNFGIGSSREQASEALKTLGVAAVVARSFGGIFYRNALNLGLVAPVCADTDAIPAGAAIEVDAERGLIALPELKRTIACEAIPPFLLEMVKAGGLLRHLRGRLARQAQARAPGNASG